MPLQATSGAASYDAFGGGVAAVPAYIEEVFSTTLYTGNGSTQTITTGIDVSTKGGIVWTKPRVSNPASSDHVIHQTNGNSLVVNGTGAQYADGDFGSITTTGFTLPAYDAYNASGKTFASWSFAKAPKFFDVVTYTGNGTAGRTVAHNLGSVPACMIVKRTDDVGNWLTYHTSLGATKYLSLNTTDAQNTSVTAWNNTAPTSTVFSVGSNATVNASGGTYVAYLFAHNAGGFGLTGTDNVISCGTYTGNGSTNGPVVTLGYEPQWIMVKNVGSSGTGWVISDVMRGLDVTATKNLLANDSASETTADIGHYAEPTSTGFKLVSSSASSNQGSTKYIYIAIRRGPMKVPTSGTSVYGQQLNIALPTFSFPPDMVLELSRASDPTYGQWVSDRLRGSNQILQTFSTNAESSGSPFAAFNQGGKQTTWGDGWSSGYIVNGFRRAPSFFDEVCYTGTGAGTSQTHNLGAIPELKIIKSRSGAVDWVVGGSIISGVGGTANSIILNSSAALVSNSTYWNSADTSTTFSVRAGNGMSDGSGSTYVAYLFATCAGVSKVGSYTGNGSSQTINCGFTSGARFVLIKRTDSAGDWYVWDSARGIVAGNDPHLSLNTTAAEVTTDDSVDTNSTGFVVNQLAATNINVTSATYIYLAIA